MTNYIKLELHEAEEALSFIDPNLPYFVKDEPCWSRVGRALYSEFGDSAEAMFDRWSQGGHSYNAKAVKHHWRTFSRTTKVFFRSFITLAKQSGWEPKRKEYTEEEKRRFAVEALMRREAAKKRREELEKDQWEKLKKEQALFQSWPTQFPPTQYMLKKQMTDIGQFVDVRLGRDKYNKPCLVWPIYENLFNKGRFCGFERILDKGFSIGDRVINKLSSDNAHTTIGFCTFGNFSDHGPKRIFVVGGFADAYSAHISSGEVIIAVIGEGNIPALIRRLSEEHPDIQFIASPDNDKAGQEMVKRSGDFWSLPHKDGYDWSDVYINEGRDAVAEQLQDIKGFQIIESNTRYLSAEIRKGLNILESDMGTGKSTILQRLALQHPDKKILILSHRIALGHSIVSTLKKKDINAALYLDLIEDKPNPGEDQDRHLRSAQVLVCSVDSLHRLAGSKWDIVFVDEFEQNLSQYFAKTNTKGEDSLNYLLFALRNSQYQVLADAHISNLTFDFCNYIGLNAGTLFRNTYKVAQGKKMFVYESKDHLREEYLQSAMLGNKHYVYANSRTMVEGLGVSLDQHAERKFFNGQHMVVHSKSSNEVKESLGKLNSIIHKMDQFLASPTLGTGFDVPKFHIDENGNEIGHKFTSTFAFLNSVVGTSEEGHQGINRAREINEFHIYIDPAERSEPTDPEYILEKLITEPSRDTMNVLGINPETGNYEARNTTYEWLFSQIKAKLNLSQNNYKTRFLELARKGGYEIVEVAKQELTAKFGTDDRKKSKERCDRQTLRDMEAAKLHEGSDFDALMRDPKASSFDIAVSKVNYDLHLSSANKEQLDKIASQFVIDTYTPFLEDGENSKLNAKDKALTIPTDPKKGVLAAISFLQEKERFIDGIKKLSWSNVSKKAIQALDRKDLEHAESRVKWRHISTRTNHMLKFLASAGIDKSLEYSGKMWTADEVKLALSAWLRKKQTRDSLFKNSGISVNEKTIEAPIRWFNNVLRSYGVPICSGAKKYVDGKHVNAYSVDEDKWEAIKILVALRSDGIEKSVEITTENVEEDVQILSKNVRSFIDVVSNNKQPFKAGYKEQYSKWLERCKKAGLEDLICQLQLAMAPHLAKELCPMLNGKIDPHSTPVINKLLALSGSSLNRSEASNHGPLQCSEREGEGFGFEFPEDAIKILSHDHRNVVYEVANIAVNEHKLDSKTVLKIMLEYGLEHIVDRAVAWAGSIKQAILEGVCPDFHPLAKQ